MGITPNYDLDTDYALGGNNASDYVIPSQKAIKYYVDHSSGGIVVDQVFSSSSANPQSGVAIAGELTLNYQAKLVSGTNIKTINNNSILGNGNLTLDGLPSQSGQSGKFLTTDGTDASWGTLSIAWGSITGILADQTDLTSALNDKYDASNPNGYTSVVESTVSGWGFTKNTGTVTSVNNVSPVNGNVSLTIPTVNNATLTIQKNGTTVNTFTANASTDVTANITVPTKTSDLTNDSGFITGITSSDVTTALGYTPYNSSNPNGYTSNTGTVTSVNNVSPVNGNVTLSIPSIQEFTTSEIDTIWNSVTPS